MSDYTQSIIDLGGKAVTRVVKDLNTYLSAYDRKSKFEIVFKEQKQRLNSNKKIPYSREELDKAFKAKDFWKDLTDCGSYIEFRHYVKSDKTKLHRANFCKRDKLCPPCAIRRAYKQQKKFLSLLDQEPQLKEKDWYYLVVPVKHNKTESYETVMNRVVDLRKKIIKSMQNGRAGKNNSIWSVFGGGMYSQEVTKSVNGWNVHLNFILNAPKGLKIAIKPIKNRRGQVSNQNDQIREFLIKSVDSQMHNLVKIKDNNKIKDDLLEVLKYSLKFSSMTNIDLLEIFIKSKRVRLMGAFGNLYGKGIEKVDFDDKDIIDEEFIELIFTRFMNDWNKPDYRLYKREIKIIEKKEKECE